VEINMGCNKFVALILFLLLFNTMSEVIINKIFKRMPCSIGFSGVIFGIAAWELVTNKGFDWIVLLSLGIMIAGPTIKNPKASLSGHIVGAISGVVGAILWKKIITMRAGKC
ncbi:MAG: rhomboid family intramembrane serine protease, partial [bacterium]|nr:rhomboid family intramembrane serine protease [bacterium]